MTYTSREFEKIGFDMHVGLFYARLDATSSRERRSDVLLMLQLD